MNAPQTSTITRATGAKPILGLGTWELPGDAAAVSVDDALELGYRLIDTSG